MLFSLLQSSRLHFTIIVQNAISLAVSLLRSPRPPSRIKQGFSLTLDAFGVSKTPTLIVLTNRTLPGPRDECRLRREVRQFRYLSLLY